MANPVHPIAVIGAGASGMMAAIAASRTHPRCVVLLEKEERVGRKLLATGNGRCNLLNARPDPARYHGDGAPVAHRHVARRQDSLLPGFAALGLRCREEGEGRVYPFSGQASAVLDVLRLACDRLGVQTVTGAQVTGITPSAQGFRLALGSGRTLHARRVVVAAGGMAAPSFGADGNAYPLLTRLGHTLNPTMPAIAPLRLALPPIKGLKGVRAQAALSLYGGGALSRRESGEALFTDLGISGIAAMQLARGVQEAHAAGKRVELSIALLDPASAAQEAASRLSRLEGAPLETFFTGLLHKQLGICLARAAGLSPQTPIDAASVARVTPLLSDWRHEVLGTQPFAQAQVTAGGLSLADFDPDTLESLRCPGLYACGELLDVDGDCGGYNLMWAWVSAIAAGEAAARSLCQSANTGRQP